MIILLLSIFLTTLTAGFLVSLLPPPTLIGRVLAFSCVFAAQIVLLSLCLSELERIGRWEFLAGHVLLAGLSGGVWWYNSLASWQDIRAWLKIPRLQWRDVTLEAVFAVVVLGLTLLNLAYSWDNLPYAGDAYSYHLPRSFMWAQNQTAHYFETHLVIMNQFPPNPSFYMMWLMVMRADTADWGLQVPQWLAGWGVAVAVMGLARRAGHGRRAALFSGLLLLTFPMILVQMRAIEIDLLTAWVGLAALYFAIAAFQSPTAYYTHLIYAGLAFGLFLGSKYTVFFWLPMLGVAGVVYAWQRFGRGLGRPLLHLGLACTVGWLLWGSTTYLRNWVEYGNPIGTMTGKTITVGVDFNRLDDFYAKDSNLVRYSYMIMDWDAFPDDNPLSNLHQRFYRRLDRQFNLNLETVYKFSLDEYGSGGRRPNRVGYGLLGYLLYLSSPLVAGWLLWRVKRSETAQLSLLYILIGWGWLGFFILLMPWDPYRMRYFSLLMAPLVAGIAPWFYHPRWRFQLILFLVGVGIAFQTVQQTRQQDETHLFRQQVQYEAQILTDLLPEGSRVGLVDPRAAYEIINFLPQFYYTFPPREAAPTLLAEGEVEVILESIYADERSAFPNGETVAVFLPQMTVSLRVNEPEPLKAQFEALYGFTETDGGVWVANQPAKLVQQVETVTRLQLLNERVPVGGEDVLLKIITPATNLEAVSCNGVGQPFIAINGGYQIYLGGQARAPYLLFQTCDLTFASEPTITGLELAPDQAPPPQVSDDLRFGGVLRYQGFGLPWGYEYSPCGQMAVETWWQADETLPHDFHLNLALVNEAGEVFVQSDDLLFEAGNPVMTAPRFNRRFIPLPCDLPSGLYNIKLGLYDVLTLEDFPITYADGSPHERGVHLTTIFIR